MPNIKFREEYVEQAYKLCFLLGATNERLARFFGVSDATINNWIAKNPEFRQAVHSAKEMPDAQVAHSTYLRAIGYSHPETKVHFHTDKNGKVKAIEHTVVKHYPPDTGAAAFWLKNRQGWRDKIELAGGGPNGALELIVSYEDEKPPSEDDEPDRNG